MEKIQVQSVILAAKKNTDISIVYSNEDYPNSCHEKIIYTAPLLKSDITIYTAHLSKSEISICQNICDRS